MHEASTPYPVAAILVAAGKSQRMGTCKQLLPLGEETVLARCLAALREGGIADIVVVVSPEGEAVAAEAARFAVRVVVNPDPEADMASSVRAGREALAAGAGSVAVALSDYPLVRGATVRSLVQAAREQKGRIILPLYAGRRGHPLLLPRPVLDELVPGRLLRDLVRSDPARVAEVAVDDPGVLLDMDTPEDYRAMLAFAERTVGTTRRP
ncbi:nucleotidyltransferase family protein [Geomesophilobacter sediminis]|uniref:Nucleotidyltransferase family protein n=1 Tax=Geomesophilobacter sediminis TaxID=2798584 RepID=A0A8J7M2D6_9BACT|nr:nucleotidyltransferase family protein [Geomesophilobacter sediminis]MBJ6727392.1 nucleotidyltransferase family protein [Geomesophilobacter sediminis]